MTLAILSEASPLVTPEPGGKGIWRCCLIAADVQGSSGFYPADVLRRDGPVAFPAGTHVYLDHPTRTEEQERPERGVLEMAGVLLDDARFEESPDGRGLFARVRFFEDVKDQIQQRARHVGMSIRAAGEVEESPTGRVVRTISEGISVDVVTRAGAGGRLVAMTESATPESPPAEQTQPSAVDGAIPSTSGTGALLSEVASMRTTFSDSIEQMQIEVARNTQILKESQRLNQRLAEENKIIREKLEAISERQAVADRALGESKQVGDVVGDLIEARLPLPSLVRIAKNFRAGQDIHAIIEAEREYVKKLRRESERGDLAKPESSMLGLTESAANADYGPSSSDDATDIAQFLLGSGM